MIPVGILLLRSSVVVNEFISVLMDDFSKKQIVVTPKSFSDVPSVVWCMCVSPAFPF